MSSVKHDKATIAHSDLTHVSRQRIDDSKSQAYREIHVRLVKEGSDAYSTPHAHMEIVRVDRSWCDTVAGTLGKCPRYKSKRYNSTSLSCVESPVMDDKWCSPTMSGSEAVDECCRPCNTHTFVFESTADKGSVTETQDSIVHVIRDDEWQSS